MFCLCLAHCGGVGRCINGVIILGDFDHDDRDHPIWHFAGCFLGDDVKEVMHVVPYVVVEWHEDGGLTCW